jgi:hypothetical protein
MRESFKNKVKVFFMLAVSMGVVILLLTGMDNDSSALKEEALTPSAVKYIQNCFKEATPHIAFLNESTIVVAATEWEANEEENKFIPFLILSPDKPGKVLWLKASWIHSISASPDGKKIAYSVNSINTFAVWLIDLQEKRVSQVAPDITQGKFPGAVFFLDDKHLVLELMEKRLWEEVIKPSHNIYLYQPELLLKGKERERFKKLNDLFWQHKLTPQQAKEYAVLYAKCLKELEKKLKPEEKKELEEQSKAITQAITGREVYIIDLETGEGKELYKGGELVHVSQDKKWAYVRDKRTEHIFKVSMEKPEIKEDFLPFYYTGLRIKSEEPLQIGFPYPSLFQIGVLIPPSTYKCYCYEKNKDRFVLKKTINIGDKRFPSDARLHVPAGGSYVFATSDKGFYLKEMKKGTVKKIDNALPLGLCWNEDGTKVAYAKESKNGYEIWFYDIIKGRKQRLFP